MIDESYGCLAIPVGGHLHISLTHLTTTSTLRFRWVTKFTFLQPLSYHLPFPFWTTTLPLTQAWPFSSLNTHGGDLPVQSAGALISLPVYYKSVGVTVILIGMCVGRIMWFSFRDILWNGWNGCARQGNMEGKRVGGGY